MRAIPTRPYAQRWGVTLKQTEVEKVAHDFRCRAKLGEASAELAPNIAASVLGRSSVRVVENYPTPATVIWVGAAPIIYIRADAPDKQCLLGHEMGHVALRWAGWVGSREAEERLASRIGVAIIAPPEAIRRACKWFASRIGRVANCFYITQTCAALRIAEVLHEERAVVTRSGNVMVRTFGGYPWASIDIVDAARGIARPELAKANLTGPFDRGRVALKAG